MLKLERIAAYAAEVTATVAILVALWNFLDARYWRQEFRARPYVAMEFSKFMASKVVSTLPINSNLNRTIAAPQSHSSLIYVVTPNDCGQPLTELSRLLPLLAQQPLDVSVVMVGASNQELRQIEQEFNSSFGNHVQVAFFGCEKCKTKDIGISKAPYRIVASVSRNLVLDEGIVSYRGGSVEELSKMIVDRTKFVAAIEK